MTINPILVSSSVSGDKICGYGSLLVHATGVGDASLLIHLSSSFYSKFARKVAQAPRFKVEALAEETGAERV